MTSRHEIEAAELAARLRRKNASGGKRKLKVFARTPVRNKSTAGRASRNAGSWKSNGKSPAALLKIHKGGLAGDKYAEESKGARFLDSNMLGRNHKEREAEWGADQARHPNVKKNLFVHASISRPKGHDLTPEQWTQLLRDWLTEIGANGVNYTAVRHSNTDNDHIHVIFSRALPNGKLLSDSQNFYKWRAALRQAEEKNGLKSIDAEIETMSSQSDRQVSANRRAARRGTKQNYIDSQLIDQSIEESADFIELTLNLKKRGIQMESSKRKDGAVRGILFKLEQSEEFLAGTSVDRRFSLGKIETRLSENRQMKDAIARRIQEQRMAQARIQNPSHQIPRERG